MYALDTEYLSGDWTELNAPKNNVVRFGSLLMIGLQVQWLLGSMFLLLKVLC
jgi:hypothetical protein